MARLDTNETAEQLQLLLAGSDRQILSIRVDHNGLSFTVRDEGPEGGGIPYSVYLKSKDGVEIDVVKDTLTNRHAIGKIMI